MHIGNNSQFRPQSWRKSTRWPLVQPSAACNVRCNWSILMSAGTSMRRKIRGCTSRSVTFEAKSGGAIEVFLNKLAAPDHKQAL